MAIIDVLRHRSTKRTSCTSNEQSLVMINKGTRLPAKRKSAKNEIHNIPFGVKKTLLSSRRLKIPWKNISGQVREMMKPEEEVSYPKIQNRSLWQRRGFEGSTVRGRTKKVELPHQPYPTQVPRRIPTQAQCRRWSPQIWNFFANLKIVELYRGWKWRIVRATPEVSFKRLDKTVDPYTLPDDVNEIQLRQAMTNKHPLPHW